MTKRKDTILASVLDFILNPIDYNTEIAFYSCPCYNDSTTICPSISIATILNARNIIGLSVSYEVLI
jgi:hypothetical protein